MSFDPNTGLPEEEPQKPGMSGCMKAALILGVVGVVCVIGCCGGAFYFGKQSFDVNNDPQQAAAIGQEILEADFLGEFQAKTSVKINIPFVGPFMTMVMYEKDDGSSVMIGQMDPKLLQGQNQQQMETQFREAFNKQSNQGKVQTVSSTTRDLNVREQKTPFTFAKIKPNDGPHKDEEMWMVSGMFQGKGGPTFMMLVVPSGEHTEDELAQMIESIK